MILLLGLSALCGVAGLLAVGFGIPIKDTTFGNTIQLAGIMLLCTALLLAGLAFVIREFRAVGRLLTQGVVRVPQRAGQAPARTPRPAQPGSLAPIVEPGGLHPEGEPADESDAATLASPPPWAAEAAARATARTAQPSAAPVDTPAPPEPAQAERPQRRNLLFATRRRDRVAPAGGPEAAPADIPPMAPPVLPPTPALEAAPKASFDSAWPAARGNEAASRRPRAVETPVATAPPTADETQGEAAAPAAQTGVTVIKSGVVDGMAYSLYSDGSIEAQMPEGVLRFGSLDELRSHLEHRS